MNRKITLSLWQLIGLVIGIIAMTVGEMEMFKYFYRLNAQEYSWEGGAIITFIGALIVWYSIFLMQIDKKLNRKAK